MPSTLAVAFARHPQTPMAAVRSITAQVRRAARTLTITFVLDADLGQLRIPPPHPPEPVHGLWQHTCFEAFVAVDEAAAYHELNVAPSGDWMVYAFKGYRDFVPRPDEMPAPDVTTRRSPDRLALEVLLHLDTVSAAHAAARLRLALAAVIEDQSGTLAYWALRHPSGQPDFHHPNAFAITLAPPGVDSDADPR